MFSPAGVSNYFRILSGDTSSHTDQSKRFVSPAGIAGVASDAVKAGWVSVFGLLIAINIFVGLFNLLPLLPFDGGHIAIALVRELRVDGARASVRVDVGQADADHRGGGGGARASSSCRASSSTSPTRSRTPSELLPDQNVKVSVHGWGARAGQS